MATSRDESSDPLSTQSIPEDVVKLLNSLRPVWTYYSPEELLKITTGKIDKSIIKALRESRLEERLSKVERRQGTFTSAIKRGLTQILKNMEGE